MEQGHRAAHDLIHAMNGWDSRTRMALIVLCITGLNGIDRYDDEGFRTHARECLLDVLTVVPGLIEWTEAE
jgi:hypothetical protein